MGKTPPIPKNDGKFVGDTAQTYGTKPGTGLGNGKRSSYWRWDGNKWSKISQKKFDSIKHLELGFIHKKLN